MEDNEAVQVKGTFECLLNLNLKSFLEAPELSDDSRVVLGLFVPRLSADGRSREHELRELCMQNIGQSKRPKLYTRSGYFSVSVFNEKAFGGSRWVSEGEHAH